MKTQANLKASTVIAAGAVQAGTSLNSGFTGQNPQTFQDSKLGKLQAKKTIIGRIETVIKFVKSRADLLAQLDAELPPVMLQTLYHFEKHGDVSLADMLVKGIYASDQPLAQEVIFWFKKYSPISWDASGKAYVRNREEHPLNVDGAEATPYHAEAEVQAKREQSKRKIEPFGPKVAFQRITGLLNALDKAMTDEGRGLAEGIDPADLKVRLSQIVEYSRGVLNIPLNTDKTPTVEAPKVEASNETLTQTPPESVLIKGTGRNRGQVSAATN